MANKKKWLEEQIEWHKGQIEWYNKDIARMNERITRLRKEDEELREWVWSKGPLAKSDWEIYATKDTSLKYAHDYQQEMKYRRHAYKWRKHYIATLAGYERRLEDLNNGRNSR